MSVTDVARRRALAAVAATVGAVIYDSARDPGPFLVTVPELPRSLSP